MSSTGIVLVESVEGMPGDLFVARVKMPDGKTTAVCLPRVQRNPQTVIFSLQAAAILWQHVNDSPLAEG